MAWSCMRRPLGEDFAAAWYGEPGPRDGRPSVLFESRDGAEAHAAWKLLERHGYRTMWCPGPGGGFSPQCTLTTTGRCPLVDRADAVVSALDLSDARCQEVARALNAVAPDTAVVVVARKGSAAQWSAELPACRVVAGPLSSKVLVGSLTAGHAESSHLEEVAPSV